MFEHPHLFFKAADHKPKKFSIEFVSANPTGPLHIGHGRGGIIGDVLGNVISFLGDDAVKEFYINDAGNQIEKLGISLKVRCQQEQGLPAEIPEGGYQGEYLKELAPIFLKEFGDDAINQSAEIFGNFAKERLLNYIKETLIEYGINFDVWFSEKVLHENGDVAAAVKTLTERGHTYKKENALWLKTTEFGDDKDRVLQRANGEYTYIAADVAYMQNKLNRGFDKLIFILGQDHHSYVIRLKAVAQALGHDADKVHIILYQLVTVKEGNLPVRLSKRAGNIISLRDIVETVGRDVSRFFYLNRKPEAHLDFDIELALKKTDENPVYYIQYAYVRTNSILKKAETYDSLTNISADDLEHLDEEDRHLVKKIASLKELLANIAKHYQTHLLTYYSLELAKEFHSYYNKHKVIDLENIDRSRARLALIKVVNNTLELCLQLLGLETPEKM
jgi:arginyl-tRNA synthetase